MNKSTFKITAEDRIKLTQDQINLIELAFDKQIPVEDAEFMEKTQKESYPKEQSFAKLSDYFIGKYGLEFGMLLLAAIMGGEDQYKTTKKSIEEQKAKERVSRES